MAVFCRKNLDDALSFGEQLKQARQKNNLGIEEVIQTTRIPKKYLEALEDGRFFILPKAKAHRLAYIRALAETLKINQEVLLYNFKKEGGLNDLKAHHDNKMFKKETIHFSPMIIRMASISILIFLFLMYLILQIRGIITPPKLIAYSPDEGLVAYQNYIVVQGETDKEILLTINGQETQVDEKGKFSTNVSLTEGVNTIILSATKKHGKTTIITRHVVSLPNK